MSGKPGSAGMTMRSVAAGRRPPCCDALAGASVSRDREHREGRHRTRRATGRKLRHRSFFIAPAGTHEHALHQKDSDSRDSHDDGGACTARRVADCREQRQRLQPVQSTSDDGAASPRFTWAIGYRRDSGHARQPLKPVIASPTIAGDRSVDELHPCHGKQRTERHRHQGQPNPRRAAARLGLGERDAAQSSIVDETR